MANIHAGGDPIHRHLILDATCTACGCLCDDIELAVDDCRIVEARRACPIGEAWFVGDHAQAQPSCRIDGRPAELEAGYLRAAEILAESGYPLICGLTHSTCEAQRLAVSIADWIGATVDSAASTCLGLTSMPMQNVGAATCTLGEVANRADLILFWGTDPAETHPRHFERYSLEPAGMFVPGGRADRTCVVVDAAKTRTAAVADLFIQIKPGSDFEALWTLRALAKDVQLDADGVFRETGVPLSVWQDLLARMKACKYGVLFYGTGLANSRGEYCNTEALLALVRDLNAFTRFAAIANRGRGNATGAENVMAWRTGLPFGVNHARGYPRYNPGEYTMADVLSRREADVALLIGGDLLGGDPELPQPAREHLASIPTIVLDTKDTPSMQSAAVAFTVATYGIHAGGTDYRTDGVPLPLRPALYSHHPSEETVLGGIERCVREIAAMQA